ncbi:WD repeat-containing protein 74-like [Triticum dicoccoides]|uniref:WD repeat-containing protein 74-like n=1 Tax=Triticum dicoccoides TaxID=85692 RepID=UPI0003D51CB4|nr:WD repeat-containing protein 74-like [Triticum dicoccoides]
MPRITSVDSPGCPPLRAITTDILGLIKVIEARARPAGIAKVVETWGEPDASRAILVASLADRAVDPVLAVARKNGVVELLNPLNGDALAVVKSSRTEQTVGAVENDPLVALHLFRKHAPDLTTLGTFLACTEKGKASVRSVAKENTASDSDVGPSSTWDVCNKGTLQFSSVDAGENYAVFGGNGMEVNLWDITSCSKMWSAKSPRANNVGIFTKPWFTAGTFLCKDDHRKIVACTNNHQVRLYDTASQRRPVVSVDFRESPIKAVVGDPDGHTVYIGTGTGDLASFDMRTGKLLGCYVGKCSGSIRSIVRHPELPLIASCGLDSYLRIWDTNTRQPLSAVYLKQHLTTVVIDSHFSAEESEETKSKQSDSSMVAEAAVRREKKKKNVLVEEDEEGTQMVDPDDCDAEAVIRKEKKKKKKKTVPEDNEETQMVDPDEGDAETVRKEEKKKNRRVAEDEEGTQMAELNGSDAEMYAPKRIKSESGERSKGMKKKSKKQQVA